MTGARGWMARGGLLFFAVVSAVLGVVILVAPERFFSLSWVNLGMPYNPHLLLDYGAMNLALAIPLAASALAASPLAVRSGLGSYAVWSAAHLSDSPALRRASRGPHLQREREPTARGPCCRGGDLADAVPDLARPSGTAAVTHRRSSLSARRRAVGNRLRRRVSVAWRGASRGCRR